MNPAFLLASMVSAIVAGVPLPALSPQEGEGDAEACRALQDIAEALRGLGISQHLKEIESRISSQTALLERIAEQTEKAAQPLPLRVSPWLSLCDSDWHCRSEGSWVSLPFSAPPTAGFPYDPASFRVSAIDLRIPLGIAPDAYRALSVRAGKFSFPLLSADVQESHLFATFSFALEQPILGGWHEDHPLRAFSLAADFRHFRNPGTHISSSQADALRKTSASLRFFYETGTP